MTVRDHHPDGTVPSENRLDCCGYPAAATTRRTFLSTLLATLAAACAGPSVWAAARREQELLAYAASLDLVTVDMLCHAGGMNQEAVPDLDASVAADMRAGGVDAALFAAVPLSSLIVTDAAGGRSLARDPEPGELLELGQAQLDKVRRAVDRGILALALSPDEILAAKGRGVPCALLGCEGMDLLEGDLSRAQLLYDSGLRQMQLVHVGVKNQVGDVQTAPPEYGGLTPFGADLIREMNRLGVLIDLSHASAQTVQDAVAASRRPVICSHTGPRALRPLDRFLADEDLRAIAGAGGVIGVMPLARTFDQFIDEIEYVASVVGMDHVGIGTDMLGLPFTVVPTHQEWALIPAGLLSRGYAEADVAKIVGGNFMRVFREVSA